MNNLSKLIISYCTLTLLTACSPIDSVKPFDKDQITTYLNQNRAIQPAEQRVSLTLPDRQDWKRLDVSTDKKGAPIMLLPIDESANDWTESFQTKITGYIGNPDMNAKKMVLNEFALAAKQCQHARGNILSQTRQAVVYQLAMTDCTDGKNLQIVGKAFNGNDGVYLVYYSAVTPAISKKQIANMSQVIQASQLS